jgi:hypothetical protein
MTVIVRIQDNRPEYDSIDPLEGLSEEAIKKANALNELIKARIGRYVKKAKVEEEKKERVLNYWEIGHILRDIYYNSGLVLKEEKDLFLKNVRIHLDPTIFPGDDVSRNRNIPEQFFRLAGFSKQIISKVKWTTWSYIFDSPIFSKNSFFDRWFSDVLSKTNVEFNQSFSRLWAQSFNVLFRNVDISKWKDEEAIRAVECMFDIVDELARKGFRLESKEVKDGVKQALQNTRKEFILMKIGEIPKEEYIQTVITKSDLKTTKHAS